LTFSDLMRRVSVAFAAMRECGDEISSPIASLPICGSRGSSVSSKLIVADVDAQKRAQARQMGAVTTIDNSAPDAVKQVMEATDGGAAAAIDFVGSPETMEFGVNILRKGGKLVMVGLYGGACPISTVLFPFKMMTIEGSYVVRSMI
jgi:threonine dehydrogenase-like Zn-dependent dehydrogenase